MAIKFGKYAKVEIGEDTVLINLPEVELDLVYYEDYLTAVPAHFLKEYVLNHNNKL